MSLIYGSDDGLGQRVNQWALDTGIEDGTQLPDTWDSFGKGVGMGIMRETFSRTGQTVAMAGSTLAVAGDEIRQLITGDENDTRAQDWYFGNVVEKTNDALDYWTPNPQEVGAAGQLFGGLAGGLGQLAIGAGNPSLMIANAQIGTATDLVRQGVDAETAQDVGTVAGVATGVGAWLPIFGKTAAGKIIGNAAANPVVGIAQRAASQQLLADNPEQAAQFNPFDLQAIAVDALMGAAFGAVSAKRGDVAPALLESIFGDGVSAKIRAGEQSISMLGDVAPELLESIFGDGVSDKIRAGEQSIADGINSMLGDALLTRTNRDAIATVANYKSFAIDSMPGRPVSDADVSLHQINMETAMRALLEDRPLTDGELRAASFEPARPVDTAPIRAAIEEVIGPIEPEAVPETVTPEAVVNPAPDSVATETVPTPETVANADAPTGYAAQPEVRQAIAAGESIRILDDDGNVISGREAIEAAAAEVDSARSLTEGFKAAALCAMRFA